MLDNHEGIAWQHSLGNITVLAEWRRQIYDTVALAN